MTTIICGFAGAVLRTTIYKGGLPADISAATILECRIFRPDGTVITNTAVFTTDGSNGQIEYVTVATDTAPGGVDLDGPYRYRFRVVDAANALNGWLDDRSFAAELNL